MSTGEGDGHEDDGGEGNGAEEIRDARRGGEAGAAVAVLFLLCRFFARDARSSVCSRKEMLRTFFRFAHYAELSDFCLATKVS